MIPSTSFFLIKETVIRLSILKMIMAILDIWK